MRILYANTFLAPQSIGGATRVVDELMVEMAQLSQVEAVAGLSTDAYVYGAHTIDLSQHLGGDLYRLRVEQRPRMDWFPVVPANNEFIGLVLDDFQPSIVHAHSIQRMGVGLIHECAQRRIPILVTMHDAWWVSNFQFLYSNERAEAIPYGRLGTESSLNPEQRLLPEDLAENSDWRDSVLREALTNVSHVTTVSRSFSEILRLNGVDCEVVSNWVRDPSEWNVGARAGHPELLHLIHLGGMEQHKGLPVLRQALEQVSRGYRLTVIDYGKDPNQWSTELWGQTPVTVRGRVAPDRVRDLLSDAHVLVAVSLWPESYGLVAREAAAAGCWVLASDIGALTEEMDPRGMVVVQPTLESVRGALLAILEDAQSYVKAPPIDRQFRRIEQAREEYYAIYESLARSEYR